jgi:Restriction endonuclease BglII
VDCFKGKIALEVEWNNKDPFFDRDLNNFRLLFELRVIDVGIVVTRSTGLQKWLQVRYAEFNKSKDTFGPSTTHMDKLAPRILGGGAGGCPVLVFAMTEHLYLDDRT